jgi:hypothetical protein
MRSVVPWSRIFADQEVVCAINTDPDSSRSAWVTIDDSLHKAGDNLTCRYSSDSAQIGSIASTEARNGKAVKLTVPKGGFVVFK